MARRPAYIPRHLAPAKPWGVSGSALKILALASMTVDHVGELLFPDMAILRVVGRLAFPIFAYMIAEGCAHTHDKAHYLGVIAALGIACQVAYGLATGDPYMGILVVFSLSIVVVYAELWVRDAPGDARRWLALAGAVAGCAAFCLVPPVFLRGYYVDYGFWGIMLPAVVALGRTRWEKLALTGLALVPVAVDVGGFQWWAFIVLVPLALYDGTRGHLLPKNFFYIYYPAHLVVIYLVGVLFFGI